MHDILDFMQQRAGAPEVPPQPAHLRPPLRVDARTSCCRSPTTRWSTASARSPARCRATTGSASRTCACSTRSCGPIPGRSSSSWAASSASRDEWNHDRAPRLVTPRDGPLPPRRPAAGGDLNHVYRSRARAPRGRLRARRASQWMDCSDWEQSIVAFCRFSRGRERLLSARATSRRWRGTAIGSASPRPGFYREVINSDASVLRRRRRGQRGRRARARPSPWHGQPHSVALTLPPLAASADPGLSRAHRMADASRTRPGRPYPLGATWDGAGVNFALFSEHATAVALCLFDERDPGKELRQIRLERAHRPGLARLRAGRRARARSTRTG